MNIIKCENGILPAPNLECSTLINFELIDPTYNNVHQCKICPWSTKSFFAIINHVKRHRFSLYENYDCGGTIPEYYFCKECSFKTFFVVNIKKHIKDTHQLGFRNTDFGRVLTKYRCRTCHFQTFSGLVRCKHSIQTGCPNSSDITFECNLCDYKTPIGTILKKHHQSVHVDAIHVKIEEATKNVKRRKKKRMFSKLKKRVEKRQVVLQWLKSGGCKYRSSKKNMKVNPVVKAEPLSRTVQNKAVIDLFKSKAKKTQLLKSNTTIKKENPLKRNNNKKNEHLKKNIITRHTVKKNTSNLHGSKSKKEKYHVKKVKTRRTVKKEQFRCDHCEIKYTAKASLKRHIISRHTADELIEWFECNQCEYKAKRKDSCTNHVRSRHPNI